MHLSGIVTPRLGPPERSFVRVAAIVAAVATIFWSTGASMVVVWSSSGTYSHGFFIVPVFLWLVWGRRHELARLAAKPTGWALAPLAASGMLWLAGHWMALAQPSQFAMVAMVPLAMASVLGIAWVKALLFPLAYLFFAVPFGESLVPVLMDWTADFTVAALRASGVPVYRDGLHFDIPSGKWSVVDSCSGIRYLFACLAASSLYGWMIYRSNARRLIFIGIALVIAIVANWVRAYAIVMLGHLSNNQIATGADHLVYGAVFFAIIMALVFGLGAVWREDSAAKADAEAAVTARREGPTQRAGTAAAHRWVAPALTAVVIMMIWPMIAVATVARDDTAARAGREIQPRGRWALLEQPVSSWRPVLNNPARVVSQSFGSGAQAVGVHIGVFRHPTAGSKLTSALNRLVEPNGLNPKWKLVQLATAQLIWAGAPVSVRSGVLTGSEARLLAWQWYCVDGKATADPIEAAWLQLSARLRGRGDASGWIVVYTRDTDDPVAAAQTLAEFVAEMALPIQSVFGLPDPL
jgi:exosortase A